MDTIFEAWIREEVALQTAAKNASSRFQIQLERKELESIAASLNAKASEADDGKSVSDDIPEDVHHVAQAAKQMAG